MFAYVCIHACIMYVRMCVYEYNVCSRVCADVCVCVYAYVNALACMCVCLYVLFINSMKHNLKFLPCEFFVSFPYSSLTHTHTHQENNNNTLSHIKI